MKKISLIFLLILLIFTSQYFVFAQEEALIDASKVRTIAKDNYGQICLNAVKYDVKEVPAACNEQEVAQGMTQCYNHIPPGSAAFTLEGNGFPTNTPIYPFVCVANEAGFDFSDVEGCFASTPENSLKLFGTEATFNYVIDGSQDGTVLSPDGSLTITGTINQADMHTYYTWYGGFFFNSIGTGGESTNQGNDASQKLSTVTFYQQFNQETSSVDCVNIHWDPYGRVFDSVSLEPIPNVSVSLLSQLDPGKLVGFTQGDNPELVKQDGVFNFMVPEGIYYLRVSNLPVTHQFLSNPNLNPIYSSIYHRAKDGKSSIYHPDEAIVEMIDTPAEEMKGTPDLEERDIPLDPGENSPFIGDIVSIEGLQQQVTNGIYTKLYGKASHPFPIVSLVRGDNGQVVFKKEFLDEEARYGFWKFIEKNEDIPSDTALVVKLAKNPKYFKTDGITINNQVNLAQFEPILRTIKGFVYDTAGNKMPLTRVKIKLKMNDAIYSFTSTNEKGYMELYSNQLPPFPYYLEYMKTDGEVIRENTSSFVHNNIGYIKENQLEPMREENNPDIVRQDISKLNKISTPASTVAGSNGTLQKQNKGINNNVIAILIAFILAMIITIIAFLLYIKKHRLEY